MALNRNYKDSDGNKRRDNLVDVECFGPRAEAAGRFFSKGRPIFVEGRLKLDQWESKEGKNGVRFAVLDNFEFVDAGKPDTSVSPEYSQQKAKNPSSPQMDAPGNQNLPQ